MILGTGADIVDVRRIERVLARFGERFAARFFTDGERARAERGQAARTYAKRFAAKEACAKALGVGFGRDIGWREVEVVNDGRGRPSLTLTGGAAARLRDLTPPGHEARCHLTLSDEVPYAMAWVIIEALPRSFAASE